MKNIFGVLIVLLCAVAACIRPTALSPQEFTSEYADALRRSAPGLNVQIVGDLELKVTSNDGREFKSFLNNVYDSYKQTPKDKDNLIKTFIAAGLEASLASDVPIDKTRIVPIIKDKAWMEETKREMLARGVKDPPEHVYEEYNNDLVVLYAEDSPNNIRYLTPSALKELNIDTNTLRSLACANLKNVLPQIERRGADGTFVLTAGGTYEASLLLLDKVWSKDQIDVKGDIVVAIPTRDLLLVTGSDDVEGMRKVRVKPISSCKSSEA